MARANRFAGISLLVLGFLLHPLAIENPAGAALIFIPGAEASASARSANNDAGTVSNRDPAATSAVREVSSPDFARGEARATTAGALGSRSRAGGASGTNQSSQASATARWAAAFTTTGANPGSAVDIDFVFNVDGFFSFLNNNTNVTADDIAAGVTVRLGAQSNAATTTLFDGSARLSSTTRQTAPILVRSGDWAAADRADDFAFQSRCDAFRCGVDVDAAIPLANAIFVDFSEVFAISVELSTDAFSFAGFETDALADFLNTASVALSTSTPGVNLRFVPTVTAVPTPASLWLFCLGLVGLVAMRPRRS